MFPGFRIARWRETPRQRPFFIRNAAADDPQALGKYPTE
jgi:hypothetical protein